MKNQKILSAENLENIWEVVNGLTGFNLDKEDVTDEVIVKSLIYLKLNEIENQFEERGIELSFTSYVSEYILTKVVDTKNPILHLNKFLKNKVLKFLLSKSTLKRFKKGSKHIIDFLDGKIIFRHSIAFEV